MGDGGVSQAPCLSSLDSKLLVLTLESRGWVREVKTIRSVSSPPSPPSLSHFLSLFTFRYH